MAKPARVHTIATLLANGIEEGGCLLWQGSMSMQNVPQIYSKGEGMVQVRKLLTRLLGADRGERYYGVSCQNPACIAPEHTVQRSQKAHSKLMAKSAHSTGKAAHRIAVTAWRQANPIKLDMDRARAIRVDTRPSEVIAMEYGVHRSLVCRIRKGTAWKDTSNPFAGLMALNDSSRRNVA